MAKLNPLLRAANHYYLNLVFFGSLIAAMGSLFLSEIVSLNPCELCWYQRVLAYPMVLLSGIALWKKDTTAKYYFFALSILGAPLAFYHYLIQKSTIFQGLVNCDPVNPCTKIDFEVLGFVTIPLMSLLFFSGVLIVSSIAIYFDRERSQL